MADQRRAKLYIPDVLMVGKDRKGLKYKRIAHLIGWGDFVLIGQSIP